MYKYSTWIVLGFLVFVMNDSGMAQTLAVTSSGVAQEATVGKKIGAVRQMTGTVKTVDLVGKTLNIKNHRSEQIFVISPETKVKKGRVALKLTELRPGAEVLVNYREFDGQKQAGIIKVKP